MTTQPKTTQLFDASFSHLGAEPITNNGTANNTRVAAKNTTAPVNNTTANGVTAAKTAVTEKTAATDAVTTTDAMMTLEELLALCVQLQPVEAAERGDSALCVTPLITRLCVDGEVVALKLRQGRWGAAYPRVSSEVQRAAESGAGKPKQKARRRKSTPQVAQAQSAPKYDGGDLSFPNGGTKTKGAADGYSEEEQLTRQIRYFVREGLAFKVYSDCGLTGEYPSDDPRLIRRLLDGKAARYRKIYERTLLDETSLLRRTPAQVASMRTYLDKRVAQIKNGLVTDNEFTPSDDDLSDLASDNLASDNLASHELVSSDQTVQRRPGRPRRKVYFRQAFTQLWQDIVADCVCTVAVSDRSRLCRAADLESEFLMLLSQHQTRLVGLIEDLSTLDVSDPLRKGFAYMIASVNEYRLEEICGHSFRGFLQLLESGHPHGRLPWWLLRDVNGRAVEMPAYMPHARRVAELYLSGLGVGAIVTKLHAEGVLIGGEPLTPRMVRYVLDSDAACGLQWQFGLAWDIFPPLLPPQTVAELRERRQARRDMLIPTFGERQPGRTWANHLFTGLLRCACGLLLRYSHPSRTQRQAGRVGYYYCPAPHKRAEGAAAHAWMNEDKLSAFFGELLGENPHLIADALRAGGDRAAGHAVRRGLLEERLQQARQEFADQEAEAQAKAAQIALGAGIGAASASFGSVVAEISRGLLETERASLAALEAELAVLGAQAGQDKQAARVLSALEQLGGSDQNREGTQSELGTMTVLMRNNLLKAIFSEITIHPLEPKSSKKAGNKKIGGEGEPHGCLVLRLAGVETPLPPVRMRRLRGKEMRLPSVAEWITDIFALAPVEEAAGTVLNARTMRPFYRVFLNNVSLDTVSSNAADAPAETPLGRLAACIRADPAFPRRSRGRENIAAHLAGLPLYDDVRRHLGDAWEHYLTAERRRPNAATQTAKLPNE